MSINTEVVKRVAVTVGTTALVQTAVMALNAMVLTVVSRKTNEYLNRNKT